MLRMKKISSLGFLVAGRVLLALAAPASGVLAAENAAHQFLLPNLIRDRGHEGPKLINGVLYKAVTDETLERDRRRKTNSAAPVRPDPSGVPVKEINQYVSLTRPTPIVIDPRERTEVSIGSVTRAARPGQPPPLRKTNHISIGSTEFAPSETHAPVTIRTFIDARGVRILSAPAPGKATPARP